MSAPQTFSRISPERYAHLAEKARSVGIPIEGESGSAAKFGIEVSWNYSPAAEELTIQCLRAPFFLSSDQIDAKIRSLVREAVAV